MNTVLLVDSATDGSFETAVVVAVITAVGLILAALVTVLGQRNTARLDAIEKTQETLRVTLDRLERRVEDGLARLADRIDRLYGNPVPSKTLVPPESSEDLAQFLKRWAEADAGFQEQEEPPEGSQSEAG